MSTYWQKTTEKLNVNSPYFSAKSAEVGKEYTFQFIGHRELDESDKFFDEEMPKFELTIVDNKSGQEKKWTVSPSVVRKLEEEGIEPNDNFTVKRTGEIGQKYWNIKKSNA